MARKGNSEPAPGLGMRDLIGSFAPGQRLRAAVCLTYSFDGQWFEQVIAPSLFDRPVESALIVRDRHALIREAPSVRYHRANARFSQRVFHPKLLLLVAEDRALAVVSSANLTRGGLERNLEVGVPYQLSVEEGPRALFSQLHSYLATSVRGELAGDSRRVLDDACTALREVVERANKPNGRIAVEPVLLHNYRSSIWDQLSKRLPHRVLRRALIVSPFFEAASASNDTESSDDPPDEADSTMFGRLFEDYEFDSTGGVAPVAVYFRHESGRTLLPVGELRRWKKSIELRARNAESPDARLLHAKLLVFEGAAGEGREAYLAVVHGSPNFTGAALLRTPPNGNSELAVLTLLPTRHGGAAMIERTLGLAERFERIDRWDVLRPVDVPRPLPPVEELLVADATLQFGHSTIALTFASIPEGASRVRLVATMEGQECAIGEENVGASREIRVRVTSSPGAFGTDGLFRLGSSEVVVQFLDLSGEIITSTSVPLNVDMPGDFYGLTQAGPASLGLDEVIGHTAGGVLATYSAMRELIERRRILGAHSTNKGLEINWHQADLDRFYRNVHHGLRSFRATLVRNGNSEFTIRRSLRELARWCGDATEPEANTPREWRVWLLRHLLGEVEAVLDRGERVNAATTRSLHSYIRELELSRVMVELVEWFRSPSSSVISEHVRECSRRARTILVRLGQIEAEQ